MSIKNEYLQHLMETVEKRNPTDSHFLAIVRCVLESVEPVVEAHPEYIEMGVMDMFVEPERVIKFRVPWVDDQGKVHVNRGYRVQGNNAIGPYKGGLRLHPNLSEDTVKFLAFEQTLKNSLTGLPIGGGKGGSDFDPKGKSDKEIMRFCQSFMNELYRHIGPDCDVPAGDQGVGDREIGYLYGQYKKLTGQYHGVLTGKGLSFGGSLVRREATGYGLCYYTEEMLNTFGKSFKDQTVVISGAGKVAIYACEKALQMGAKVVAMCDTKGYVYDADGIDLDAVKLIKEVRRGHLEEYMEDHPNAEYHEGPTGIWTVKCDIAMPCATEDEINLESAKTLIANGCYCVSEGANLPCTMEAIDAIISAGLYYGPAKAANAGGVATSALEMSQNSERLSWTFEEVDARLKDIMVNIFHKVADVAEEYNLGTNFEKAANVAGFLKVADAMLAQGVC